MTAEVRMGQEYDQAVASLPLRRRVDRQRDNAQQFSQAHRRQPPSTPKRTVPFTGCSSGETKARPLPLRRRSARPPRHGVARDGAGELCFRRRMTCVVDLYPQAGLGNRAGRSGGSTAQPLVIAGEQFRKSSAVTQARSNGAAPNVGDPILAGTRPRSHSTGLAPGRRRADREAAIPFRLPKPPQASTGWSRSLPARETGG